MQEHEIQHTRFEGAGGTSLVRKIATDQGALKPKISLS